MAFNNEFERRDYLSTKLLDLANVSLHQGDEDGFTAHFSKGLSLLLTNLQAMELEQPGFIREMAKDPDVAKFFKAITESNK